MKIKPTIIYYFVEIPVFNLLIPPRTKYNNIFVYKIENSGDYEQFLMQNRLNFYENGVSPDVRLDSASWTKN